MKPEWDDERKRTLSGTIRRRQRLDRLEFEMDGGIFGVKTEQVRKYTLNITNPALSICYCL
jgi:hypothetical protein